MVGTKSWIRWLFALVWTVITFFEWKACTDVWQNLVMVSWLIVINLVFQTFTLKMCRMSLASFYYAFIVFYYIFHFGQVFMTGLFPNYTIDYLNYVEVYMTDNNVLDATIQLCVVSINAFFIGGLLVDNVYHIPLKRKSRDFRSVIRKIFYILFPCRLLADVVQVVAAMFWGYYGAIKANNLIPGVIASLGNMWYALVPLFYLTLSSKTKRKKYFITILLYLAITMLTGNRGHQIVCLASLAIVMLTTLDKIKMTTILKYSAFALVGMAFVDIIFSMRESSISEFFSNPTKFMASTERSNILLETIGTFGETIYTPYLTIEGDGLVYNTWFGETFVKSLVGIIPDVFGWLRDINNEAIFSKNLGTKSAIGGSFCAEMYYNFKGFYPLMSLFFGYIYCRLSNIACYSIQLKKYENSIMAIVICSLALWWVRDSIGNLTRQIVWMYWLIIIFQQRTKRI